MCFGFFALARAMALSFAGLNACRYIHREVILNLIYAPLTEFFERIPLGRILNRLSKDLSLLESELWINIGSLLVNSFMLVSDVGIILYGSSLYSLISVVVFVFLAVHFMKKYRNFNREAVRLGKRIIIYYKNRSLKAL